MTVHAVSNTTIPAPAYTESPVSRAPSVITAGDGARVASIRAARARGRFSLYQIIRTIALLLLTLIAVTSQPVVLAAISKPLPEGGDVKPQLARDNIADILSLLAAADPIKELTRYENDVLNSLLSGTQGPFSLSLNPEEQDMFSQPAVKGGQLVITAYQKLARAAVDYRTVVRNKISYINPYTDPYTEARKECQTLGKLKSNSGYWADQSIAEARKFFSAQQDALSKCVQANAGLRLILSKAEEALIQCERDNPLLLTSISDFSGLHTRIFSSELGIYERLLFSEGMLAEQAERWNDQYHKAVENTQLLAERIRRHDLEQVKRPTIFGRPN